MTVSEIKTRVKQNLEVEDVTLSFYTDGDDSDLTDSIQDGYEEVCALAQTREKMALVSFVSDLVYYNFYTLIEDYINVIAIFNKNTNRWVDQRDKQFLELTRYDWELAHGNASEYWPVDFQRIAIYPHLLTATGQMEVYYAAKANILTNATTPEVLDPNTRILEYYCTADLLEQAEEFQKAQGWWDKYRTELATLISRTGNRLFPDRVRQLQVQHPGSQI